MWKFGFWVCRCRSSSTRRVRSLGESHLGTSTACLGSMNVRGQRMLPTPSVWVLIAILSNSSVFILIGTLLFCLIKSLKLFLLPGIPLHLQGNNNLFYLFIFFSKSSFFILHFNANKFSTKIKNNAIIICPL